MHNQLEKTDKIYLSDIAIILVLYKCQLENSESFLSLTKALNNLDETIILEMIVYDNSPSSYFNNKKKIKNWNIKYIHDPTNSGVSKAYNIGAKLTKEINKKWLLLVDQDSVFPNNTFKIYLDALNKYADIQLHCPILRSDTGVVISPAIFKFHRGFSPHRMGPGLKSLDDYSPVNSGICVSVDLFDKVGGYNDDIKLDYSDFYFVDKVKQIDKMFYVIDLTIKHDLSSLVKQSHDAAIMRFNYLCEGAILSSNGIKDKVQAYIVILLRGLKLCIRYKSIDFIEMTFNAIIFNQFR
jgi:rhamnosyltransferase